MFLVGITPAWNREHRNATHGIERWQTFLRNRGSRNEAHRIERLQTLLALDVRAVFDERGVEEFRLGGFLRVE